MPGVRHIAHLPDVCPLEHRKNLVAPVEGILAHPTLHAFLSSVRAPPHRERCRHLLILQRKTGRRSPTAKNLSAREQRNENKVTSFEVSYIKHDKMPIRQFVGDARQTRILAFIYLP